MPRFIVKEPRRVWFIPEKGEPAGPFHIINESMDLGPFGHHIKLTLAPDGPSTPPPNQEETMNISTKEQVEVRTKMADVIKNAVEAEYGKVRTWVETEQVGPLGGISAKVLGAVEHNGKIVPFAIQVYSDARIVDALEDQLEVDAQDEALRSKLGWAE